MQRLMCQVKPKLSHWEDAENGHLTNTLGNRFVRGEPPSLQSPVTVLLCMPDLALETAVTKLRSLNVMGLIGSHSGREQAAVFSCQRQGRHTYHNEQQKQNNE